jgi:predicted ArsR family transcriptional regulator
MSTREKIQKYIEKHPGITAAELAQGLGLTKADIQYHLKDLRSRGEILSVPASQRNRGRGRPASGYQVSNSNNNLPHLAAAVLSLVLHSNPERVEDNCLQIALAMFPGQIKTRQLAARLTACVKALSAYHYNAAWEARMQGPVILLRSCPYQAILKAVPELCEVDRKILENQLLLPVQQQTWIESDHPNSVCCFKVSIPWGGDSPLSEPGSDSVS